MATYNSLVQPLGQKRLTNVAVARLKKSGMRFEIACYKNKVLSWHSKSQEDLKKILEETLVFDDAGLTLKPKFTGKFRCKFDNKIAGVLLGSGIGGMGTQIVTGKDHKRKH